MMSLILVNAACRLQFVLCRVSYSQGGFEASTGVFINPVSPEIAAKLLRESSYV